MGLTYATPVDVWSCGCIFAELCLNGKALFAGQYEMDQLAKIFDVIGTPTEAEWPEKAAVTRSNFRDSPTRDLSGVVPELEASGRDLLQVIIIGAPFAFLCPAITLFSPLRTLLFFHPAIHLCRLLLFFSPPTFV